MKLHRWRNSVEDQDFECLSWSDFLHTSDAFSIILLDDPPKMTQPIMKFLILATEINQISTHDILGFWSFASIQNDALDVLDPDDRLCF